jgi:hypothetical protein
MNSYKILFVQHPKLVFLYSLIFETEIKINLLEYISTAILFTEKQVNDKLITWNRVVLTHGPPGTGLPFELVFLFQCPLYDRVRFSFQGKTSLCKALAQKIAIRFSHRY